MSPDLIRYKFIEEFGRVEYKEFVLSLYEAFPLRDKLFFWQEQLIEKIFNDLNIPQPTIEEVYSIFNCCPIHDAKLNADIVPIIDGNNLGWALSYRVKKTFPNGKRNCTKGSGPF
jgi:hypothetical protein